MMFRFSGLHDEYRQVRDERRREGVDLGVQSDLGAVPEVVHSHLPLLVGGRLQSGGRDALLLHRGLCRETECPRHSQVSEERPI